MTVELSVVVLEYVVLNSILEIMNFAIKYPIGRDYLIKQVRGQVMKLTKGVYPAPLKIIDVST